jgi:hypothetical protein
MDAENPGTNITWSANEKYLADFAIYFQAAQKLFLMCRRSNGLIVDLFDHVHEVYRMERPYLDKDGNKRNSTQLKEMDDRHDKLRKQVDHFATQSGRYQANNFGRLYYEIDAFFSELTHVAVEKNFFPRAAKVRTVQEITKSLRQQ